jgi:hypothetical protein
MSGPARPAWRYILLFGALYALQGIVIAYFFNFNQGYMEAAGLHPATIGTVQSIALVPLIVRFLGGPLSDRVNLFGWGNRRPYIVLGVALQGLGLAGLTRFDPGSHLAAFTALALLAVLGLALYDTATDGMILDSTTAENRPRLQSGLIASRFCGAMVTSIGFGLWLHKTGNGPGRGDGVVWTCAGLGLVPLALAIVLPEPQRPAEAESFRWAALRVLIQPRSLVLLAFGTLYSIVAYGVEINLSPYYRHLGFDERDVGLFGATRYVGRALGALALGLASRRATRSAILISGIVSLALSASGQACLTSVQSLSTGHGAMSLAGRASGGVLALAFGLSNGWNDAIFYVLAMEASDPRMAASTCALFMSVTNLSVTGGALFGYGIRMSGGRFAPLFALSGGLVLAAFAFVPAVGRPLAQPVPKE